MGLLKKVWAALLAVPLILGFFTPISSLATEPNYAEVCQSPNAILGTEGDDTIVGTEGDDIICAGGGNDTVSANGGNDIIYGGEGNDTINGGAGNDELRGEEGDDLILGGVGDDFIWLDDGTDQGFGDSGNDDIWGGAEDDYVSGGSGADNLYGDGGLDRLLGGSGNDGLDGGEGTDSLQGDSGVDYCVRDLADNTPSSCFFDNKGPQVVSVAYDPESKNMNAVTGTQRLSGRALIVDPGSGVDQLRFTFSSLLYAKSPGMLNGENSSFSYQKASSADQIVVWGTAGAPDTCEDLALDNSRSGICLKSGTIQRGVWEFFVVLPKNMRQGTWVLSGVYGEDKATNRYDVTYNCAQVSYYFNCSSQAKSLKNRKLAISFKQLEVTDTTAPKVTLLGVSGSRRQVSAEDYVRFRVGVSDASGIANVFLFKELGGNPSAEVSVDESTPLCTDQILDSEVCVESLDLTNTVVQVPAQYRIPNFGATVYNTKAFCLCSLRLTDKLGNEISINYRAKSAQAKALQLDKVYTIDSSVDDGDTWAPAIKSMSFSPKRINTSAGEKTVKVTMTITDKGVGMNLLNPSVSLSFARRATSGTEIACRQDGDWSGTANLFTIKLACTFPANYGSGKVYVATYQMGDNSQRRNNLYTDDFNSERLTKWQKLYITNG